MKTAALLSLGLFAPAAHPLRANQQISGGVMPFHYPNSVNATDPAAAPALPSSVVNSPSSTPLISGLTTNTTMQLWNVSDSGPSANALSPIANGPAILPVPDAGSSMLFLALGLGGMLILRRLLPVS